MNARKLGLTQADAAYIANISERTGQRIDSGKHRPNRGTLKKPPNQKDPLAEVWENELEPMLRREPRLKPMTLYEYLQEKYPGQYSQTLRTVQRRVQSWKALHGPAPEVMFELRHQPGLMGISDFTELKGIEVTIRGEVFKHLLYHYRLTYSGWQFAQIIQGGESFIALSEGLQNALQNKFAQEQGALQPLPQRRVPDYEVLTARVSSRSTIEVRCILYTVPSRLIGQRLELHLYHDRILGYFGQHQVFELPRLRVKDQHKRRGRCINYRHVIEGLQKKPRAFLYCTWQQELLPNHRFRQLWGTLQSQFDRDQAAVLMVEALYLAGTQNREEAVADYLEQELSAQTLSLRRLQTQFSPPQHLSFPTLDIEQHALDSYDNLLCREDNQQTPTEPLPQPQGAAQTTTSVPHAPPLGIYRDPGFAGTMVLCTVLIELVRTRGSAAQRTPTQKSPQRSSASSRKKFYQL